MVVVERLREVEKRRVQRGIGWLKKIGGLGGLRG